MSLTPHDLTKEKSEKNAFRFLELDSLRGLAALSVLLFHFTNNQPEIKRSLEFRIGITGVDIFFMISGFVILLSITRITQLRDFIVYRFSRLYPTYWVCILITATFIFFYQPSTLKLSDVFINMTMVQTFFGVEDLDGSYWTLLIELLFYFWIIGVYLIKRIKDIEDVGLITLILILAYHIFRESYPVAYSFVQAKFSITNHFPLFFSGILFYQIKFKGISAKKIIYMFISILSAFYLHDKGGRAMHMITEMSHDVIIVFFHIVFALMITGKLKFLVKPYFIFLGNISYSLYLLHQVIGRSIINTLLTVAHLNIYIAILIAMLCTISLAYLVTTYIEVPVIKQIRTRYKRYKEGKLAAELELN